MRSLMRRVVARPFALASSLLVASGLSSAQLTTLAPHEGSELVLISKAPYEESLDTSSGETQGDMNCFEVHFAGSGLRAIVQNFPDMGDEFTYHMRTLGKVLMNEVVLGSDSALNAYWRAGALYGVEYDWFFPDMSGAPPRPSLARKVEVHIGGESVDPSHFANVHGYGETGYYAFKAFVEGMIGHPMETFTVWEDEAIRATGEEPLCVTGLKNEVFGPVTSTNGFGLFGVENALHGVLTFESGRAHRGENYVRYLRRADQLPAVRGVASVDAARRAAVANGTYFPADAVITEGTQLPAGVVFAEGDVVIAHGIRGRWTFVSGSGSVAVRADGVQIRPAWGHLAALSPHGDIRLSADHGLVVGELRAPQGLLDVSGSDNTLVGSAVGAGVSLTGSGNLVTDGTLAPQL